MIEAPPSPTLSQIISCSSQGLEKRVHVQQSFALKQTTA